MSTLNSAARAAQDASRQGNGRFGEQGHSDPGQVKLTSHDDDITTVAGHLAVARVSVDKYDGELLRADFDLSLWKAGR